MDGHPMPLLLWPHLPGPNNYVLLLRQKSRSGYQDLLQTLIGPRVGGIPGIAIAPVEEYKSSLLQITHLTPVTFLRIFRPFNEHAHNELTLSTECTRSLIPYSLPGTAVNNGQNTVAKRMQSRYVP